MVSEKPTLQLSNIVPFTFVPIPKMVSLQESVFLFVFSYVCVIDFIPLGLWEGSTLNMIEQDVNLMAAEKQRKKKEARVPMPP
jgi:hypothetical protein